MPLDAGAARRAVEALGGGAGDGAGGGGPRGLPGGGGEHGAGGARRLRRAGPRPGRDDPRRLRRQRPPARGGGGRRAGHPAGARCPRPPASSAPGGSSRPSIAHHASRTHLRPLRGIEEGPLREVARGLRAEALAGLATPERAHLAWSADLRYAGQSSELNVPLSVPLGALPGAEGVAALEGAFGAAHERRYGHQAPGEPVELVHLRLVASLPAPLTPLPAGAGSAGGSGPAAHSRQASGGGRAAPTSALSKGGWTCPWWIGRLWASSLRRAADGAGPGPLIVEDYDATTLVPPGWRAALDGDGVDPPGGGPRQRGEQEGPQEGRVGGAMSEPAGSR